MLVLIPGFLILLASAVAYARLQWRALRNWRGIGRVLAMVPLLGWFVFFQKAAAASPTNYITPSLLPVDLWASLINAVIFLAVAEALLGQKRRSRY
ncbi:MAG TPA: hypothetical protein VKZ46_01500 [Pedomonas sp.]|nr:hypothetical protein [Pedomonas sp.]